jgi:hypothetical protein
MKMKTFKVTEESAYSRFFYLRLAKVLASIPNIKEVKVYVDAASQEDKDGTDAGIWCTNLFEVLFGRRNTF